MINIDCIDTNNSSSAVLLIQKNTATLATDNEADNMELYRLGSIGCTDWAV